MNVVMVTPHLPPEQAANALLPRLLGDTLEAEGHTVRFVAFSPPEGAPERAPKNVVYLPPPAGGVARRLRFAQLATAGRLLRRAGGAIRAADVVHIHSNTFMNQLAAWLAVRAGRPFVLTHYGTEIWHYRPRRPFDPFLWMNRRAAHVTYYSRRLLEHSLALGVAPAERSVVYPAVDGRFVPPSPDERRAARRALAGEDGPVLLNVKRLHPLAGQGDLLEAMPRILEEFPRARLVLAGEGPARAELERRIRDRGLAGRVVLAGRVPNEKLVRYYWAADLFVLPSLLEAFPTVAAEALATGLRVVSADHPGGVELHELFGEDVRVVPRRSPEALAAAVVDELRARRPVSATTRRFVEERLRPEPVARAYLALYRRLAPRGAAAASGGLVA